MRQINQQGDGRLRLQVLCSPLADDTAMNSFGLTTLIQFLREDDLDRRGGGGGGGGGPGVNHGGSWPSVTGRWPADVARVLRWMWRASTDDEWERARRTEPMNKIQLFIIADNSPVEQMDFWQTWLLAGQFYDKIWKSSLLTKLGYAEFSSPIPSRTSFDLLISMNDVYQLDILDSFLEQSFMCHAYTCTFSYFYNF